MKEFRICTHFLFIDIKSAYESIDMECTYGALNELNIPEKLIRMVKTIMRTTHIQVRIHGTQGCSARRCTGLPCFQHYAEHVIRTAGIQTGGKSVQLMAYTDDTVLIGGSLASVKEACKEAGLIVNEGKTKCMVAANS
jgi:hypothetical protein